MVEIEFSVMENIAGDAEQLRSLVKTFEEQYHIRVNLKGLTWDKGWNEIVKFGIYGHGPDVSSVGTTWIGSLASMGTLRPFSEKQIQVLGGPDAFFQSVWRSGFLHHDPTLWAVPWFGDAMMIYYWENMLEEAGMTDFDAAFSTDDALVQTLEKLRSRDMAHPLAINLTNTAMVLQEAAHWLWNAGGDFVNVDGTQVVFNQPAAIEGFKKYFSMLPYVSPVLLDSAWIGDVFSTEKVAIQFAGPWLSYSFSHRQTPEGMRPGIKPVPGKAFTGGSSLVLWKHTLHPVEAFEWIRFLATQPAHLPSDVYRHQVPVRRDAFQLSLLQDNFSHRTYSQYLQAMEHGRSFPTMRLWGALETHLVMEIAKIWKELLVNPDQDLDVCLHQHLDPLAHRLNLTLQN